MLSWWWVWGRLSVAGLLLAGCAFDPRGSSASAGPPDAAVMPGGGFDGGGTIVPFDAAPTFDAPTPVLLETLVIDAAATAPTQSSVVLLAGASYRLVASGVVAIRDDGFSGDADYWWDDDLPEVVGDSAGGVDIGLAVNDSDGTSSRAPDWGPPVLSHTYEVSLTGNDAVLSAQFFDPNNGNNSGSLSLEIWGPPP